MTKRFLLKMLPLGFLSLFIFAGCVVEDDRPYRRGYVVRHGPRRTVVRETVVTTAAAPVVVAPAGPQVYATPGATEEVVVPGAPPPPPTEVEVITISPGPEYVWAPGVWVWSGAWVWERGHWLRPPRAGVVWVPHTYVYRGGAHVWVRGRWR
ncbi:MAG: hypothetical protein HY301_12800 [Verrucomicrobia bacterium]|nr:hypothetical protein [Verrucomicrobiota bacterium]